jgi:peptide/nickel transport system substrate-binding protein
VRTNLDHTEIVDPFTVGMYLKRADVGIPDAFGPLEGNFLVLPKRYIVKVGLPGFEEKPLGSGPWKFIKRELGQYVEYEANTAY